MLQSISFYSDRYTQERLNVLIAQLEKEGCEIKDIRVMPNIQNRDYNYNQILFYCDTPVAWKSELNKITFYFTTTNYVIAEFNVF